MDEHTELRRALEIFVTENPDLERLESLLGEFNIFEALGAVRQELRHSDFLAFLLDPGQHHGLGDTFLKRLLQRVLLRADRPPVSAVEIDVADLEGALVLREWRNIDILIHDESSRLVCVIENKIGSGEHSNQLTRYREIVQREFPDCRLVLVYLTPDGAEPSGEAYIPLAYGDIADMIDAVRVVRESTLGADVSALMRHYTTMLRRHIVSDSEIIELCQRIYRRHKQALDLIFEHKPDLQADLRAFLESLIADAADRGLVLDHSTKTAIRFAIRTWDRYPGLQQGQGWTPTGRVLLFEFNNRADSLTLYLLIGPGPAAVREAVHRLALAHRDVFRYALRKRTPKWTMIYKLPILGSKAYIDQDFDALTDRIRRVWEKFLDQDLPAIIRLIDQVEWPPLA